MKTILNILLWVTFLYTTVAFPHERGEVDAMNVVFGGEPEPVLNGERQYLRWRFTDTKTKQPVSDLEELHASIKFDGKEFGPFDVRGSRRDPGMYQTNHIFTKPGEGEATLTFKRNGKDKVFSITFPFKVNSREAYEIP